MYNSEFHIIRIGSQGLAMKFETITCQWQVNVLTIFASRKLTGDITVTYKKGQCSIGKTLPSRKFKEKEEH